MDFEECVCLVQKYLQNNPLIVLGSGGSAPYGLPTMPMIASEICNNRSSISNERFNSLCSLLEDGYDLENALDRSSIDEEIQNYIREYSLK